MHVRGRIPLVRDTTTPVVKGSPIGVGVEFKERTKSIDELIWNI